MTHDDHGHPLPAEDPRPTAYALRGRLVLRAGCSESGLRAAAGGFTADLTRFLRERGCRLIGHIKGMLEAGERGHLFFSVTSFDEEVRCKGGLTGEPATVDFSLNVIVYGVDAGKIEPAVLEGLRRHFGEFKKGERVKAKGERGG